MANNTINQQQFYEKYLEFNEEIFKIHVKCMQHLVAILPFDKLNQIDIADRLNQNKPIINERDLIISDNELDEIFEKIYPIIKKYSHRSKEQLLQIDELNDKRKLSMKELVIALVDNNKEKFSNILDGYDVSQTILERIAELISSPYLELCAEYFNKKLSQFVWNQPNCPICGNLPNMALVNEQTNEKHLWCRFCDTTWEFKEKTCPYCLNDDQTKFKLIFPSTQSPYRLDVCECCNNYVKTIDGLITDEQINFSVKNIETYYLDLLAKKFGYNVHNYFQFYLESI